MNASWKKRLKTTLATGLAISLLTVMPIHSLAATSQVKVSYDAGKQMPVTGTVNLKLVMPNDSGFKGTLEIRKTSNTSYGGDIKPAGLTTVYPLDIQSGQKSAEVKYKTDTGGDASLNYAYTYKVKDSKGELVGSGSLGGGMTLPYEAILTVGSTVADQGIKRDNYALIYKHVPNLERLSSDEMEVFDTVILGHEDALALSKADQALLLKRIMSGGRLLVISKVGHEKSDFAESLVGSTMSQTGMTNLKGTISLLSKKNYLQDQWLETAQTNKGSVLNYATYGKGSIILIGFDPFKLSTLDPQTTSEIRDTLLIQSGQNLKQTSFDYQLNQQIGKLPEKSVPSFPILLLIFGLSLSFGLILGMYLVRFQKRPHGLLLGMCSAAALSLLIIPFYSWMLGYKGAFINEIVYNSVDAEGNGNTENYLGVKANHSNIKVVTESKHLYFPVNIDFYNTTGEDTIQTVGEHTQTWAVSRSSKWAMETFMRKESGTQPVPAQTVANFKVANGMLTGELNNTTQLPMLSPVIVYSDQWAVLPDLKAGEKRSIQIKLSDMKPLIAKDNRSATATGLLYSETQGAIAADELRSAVDSAVSRHVARDPFVIFFQVTKGSGVSIEGEVTRHRLLEIYDLSLALPIISDNKEVGSADLFSGNHKKLPNLGGAKADFQVVNETLGYELINVWQLTPNFKSATLSLDSNQVKQCQYFDYSLGIWRTLQSGASIGEKELEAAKNPEGQLFTLVTPNGAFLGGQGVVLKSKGGQ